LSAENIVSRSILVIKHSRPKLFLLILPVKETIFTFMTWVTLFYVYSRMFIESVCENDIRIKKNIFGVFLS
jgi:hypothetical protein